MSIFSKASNASYWRGFDYYENKQVFDIKKISENIYSAKVNGTKTYDVVVDLDRPLKSSCSCPFTNGNHKICKHMIALAFSVCPQEVKTALKIREDYYKEEAEKEEILSKHMNKKRKEIEAYINSLSKEELKKILKNKLLDEEYDLAYRDIYDDENKF